MSRNRADQKRLDAIHRLPCCACVQWGLNQPNRTEAHHIVSQSYRKHSGGDQATIPLCGHHHRGEPIMGASIKEMTRKYGPSLADNKRMFVATFGSERELLAGVDRLVEGL